MPFLAVSKVEISSGVSWRVFMIFEALLVCRYVAMITEMFDGDITFDFAVANVDILSIKVIRPREQPINTSI